MSATETTTRSEGALHVKISEAMYKVKIVSIGLDEKNMLNIKMNKPKESDRFMGPSSRGSTKKVLSVFVSSLAVRRNHALLGEHHTPRIGPCHSRQSQG